VTFLLFACPLPESTKREFAYNLEFELLFVSAYLINILLFKVKAETLNKLVISQENNIYQELSGD
jgi:hypothetical protein